MTYDFAIPRTRAGEFHRRIEAELDSALKPVLFGSYEDGLQTVRNAERAFAVAVGREYSVGTHSGTAGLFLALKACGVGLGHEVITVANSDISTTAAISHTGADFVLCDVNSDDHTMSPVDIEPLITDRTRAILPVDLYGHPVDATRIREIANEYSLFVVEDAALALGAYECGEPVGGFADAVVFSLSPVKPMGSVGSAGMVATDNPGIFESLRLLSGYGKSEYVAPQVPGQYAHVVEGYNLTLDPLHAAVTLVKLDYLQQHTKARRRVASQYADALESMNFKGVALPRFRKVSEPTFRSYTVLVDGRDQVYQRMRDRGVEVCQYYVPPVHLQPVYSSGVQVGNLKHTEALAERLLCLPVDPLMEEQHVEYAAKVLRDTILSCR